MKHIILTLSSILLFCSCGNRTKSYAFGDRDNLYAAVEDTAGQSSTTADEDRIIRTAIRNFLRGNAGAAVLTSSAKADLVESTWPEVYCSVEGMLDSPASFEDLTVRKVGEGRYKYECVCPDHGDRYVDCCTIHARLGVDGVVKIVHITWDDAIGESCRTVRDLIRNSTWYDTDYGFKMPNFMTPSTPIFVDDMPGELQQWTFDDICVVCWPSLGAWAVTDYPAVGQYLTEDVLIKSVTYHNPQGTIYSGYATDGRAWYMKKKILEGSSVDHASALILICPKDKQDDAEAFVNIVRKW